MVTLSSMDKAFLAAFSNARMNLILLPTEQCNFRCTYCYENFSIGRMSPGVVQGVKRLVESRLSDLRQLTITWFGGEPLLAPDIVDDISGHFTRLAADSADLRYSASMTTNGFRLALPMLLRLAAVGIREYQISLDGPRQFHDTTRIRAGGQGTFDRIWANLCAIRESTAEVRVLLRIHLTPGNLAAMRGFIAEVEDRFLSDPRFSLLFTPIARLGGPHNDEIEVLPGAVAKRAIADLTALLERYRPAAADHEPDVCYAAKPNSIVVRANGRLAKCTVALNDEADDVGYLSPDGRLCMEPSKLQWWLRGWSNGDEQTLACPLESLRAAAPGKFVLPVLQ